MPDVLARPDLQRLLREAESVRRLLVDVGDDADVRLALEGIYAELGRVLHEAVSPAPAPPVDDERTDVFPVERAPTDDEDSTAEREPPKMDAILTPDEAEELVPALPEARLADLDMPTDAAPWVAALERHLDLIALPEDLTDPAELAAEASRVQWCTMDVARRWEPFPESIRVALLGLVAARARHLRDALDVDAGPRLALERLRAYRKESGLPPVVALFPDRAPELDTWSADARRWWDTLLHGLGA